MTGRRAGYTTTTRTSAAKTISTAAFTSAPIPTVSGTTTVGRVLTANAGTWKPAATLTYRWKRAGTAITGATGRSYTLTPADAGTAITVSVTGRRAGYTTTTRTSADVAVPGPPESGPVVHVTADITADTDWDPAAQTVYLVEGSVAVLGGATLRIGPNAVIKAAASGAIRVEGGLVVEGVAGSPVVFTSLVDDSVGGDTNGDGDATAPPSDASGSSWSGVHVLDGGSATVRFAEVRYASYGIATVDERGYSSPRANVVDLSHVTMVQSPIRISVDRSGSNAGTATVRVEDCTVRDTSGDGISVTATGVPVGSGTQIPVPVVQNNTVTGAGGVAVDVRGDKLDGALLRGNSGSGNQVNAISVTGTLVTDTTIPLGGLPLALNGRSSAWRYLTVASGVTLRVEQGAVIKSLAGGLRVEGGLVVEGVAGSPVVFTSLVDDSVGGDTNGDGDATAPPGVGDWNGIVALPGGVAQLDGVDVRYAATALSVTGAEAAIHGRLTDSGVGVSSDGSYVDARDVDWGTPDGPAPGDVIGAGAQIAPWVGYTAPPRPAPAAPQPVSTSNPGECKAVAAFGLRGSGEAPQGTRVSMFFPWTMPEFTGAADGFGSYNTSIVDSFEEIESVAVKRIAIQYQALAVPVVNPAVLPGEYNGSIYDGVDKLIARMERESIDCPTEKFVVVGYSQGALAAHLALRILARTDPQLLERVEGVAFVADPGRQFNPAEDWWRSASYESPRTIHLYAPGVVESLSAGVWSAANLFNGDVAGPLPDAVATSTVSLCHNRDLVCSAFVGASVGQHTNYTESELQGLAALLARTVPGGSGSISWTLSIHP